MDLSTRLSYLFGTEEYVGMRRQFVLLRETSLNYIFRQKKEHFICSGSLGEGVAYPMSDDDVMISEIQYRVVTTNRGATQAGDVLMVPSEFSPGYCRLLDVRKSFPQYLLHIMHEMPFVSSSLWRQSYMIEGRYAHGPCQSGTIGITGFDIANCIPCYAWPDIVNDWVSRERIHEWPSWEIVQNIVRNGCHVVPVGAPDSPHAEHEWRISFSLAERTLMHSFNHTQFLVYNLLRLTLKNVIEKLFPGVLCSYFMKTTLFYTVENTPNHLWQVHNIETCFRTCISVLYDYVENIYCPNYFIPEYNMIKRKVHHTNRTGILCMVRTLYTIGIVGIIHLSGESSCLDASLSVTRVEIKLDREFMFSDHFRKGLGGITDVISTVTHEHDKSFYVYKLWRFLMRNATAIQSELIDIILNRGIKACCLKIMTYMLPTSEENRQYYLSYKTLEALLRLGFRGDVTSGKLAMAQWMFMVGRTESALYVIRQLLSEYPPYAIDVSGDNLKTQVYRDVMCGRGFSISYKVRHAYAPLYSLDDLCRNAYPSTLKLWITIMNEFTVDPLLYAYFLESLCHFQNRNNILSMKSVKCLVNRMCDLKTDGYIIEARMFVGIIKCVQGDNQSACRWLGSVYLMKDTIPQPYNERFSHSALTYISCLLNETFQFVT